MTLTQLQYVVAIAETKSMNKAAAALFVSQPALSGTIKDFVRGICRNDAYKCAYTRANEGFYNTRLWIWIWGESESERGGKDTGR